MVLEEVWGHLPNTIFALVAFVGGVSASCLPETTNVRLPETLEDYDKIKNKQVEVDLYNCFYHITFYSFTNI
uniref:Uncharacterized protein n=1 Tax=Labrus bergylta TaxID=56723 RepID=A0A3Q3N4Y0_9LABR